MNPAELELLELKTQLHNLIDRYFPIAFPNEDFRPQASRVPVTAKVFDAHEVHLLVDAALEFWLTSGRFATDFEDRIHGSWETCGDSKYLIPRLQSFIV